MVSSQHGDASTSLTLRGGSSVVGAGGGDRREGGRGGAASSYVSSRSRRYNRSHAGGSAFVPQNEFPVFSHSGDVEIVVRVATGHENRYLLHRHTLTRCSGFFEASTSNEWSRAQPLVTSQTSPASSVPPVPELPSPGAPAMIEGANPNPNNNTTTTSSTSAELARTDGNSSATKPSPPVAMGLGPFRKRWRYQLDPGSGDDDIPMLVQKEETSPSSTTAPGSGSHNLTSPTSIFGGPSPATSSSRHHHHTKSTSHSFFRSVANLSLSSSSAHHYSPPALALPPPTQAEQDLLRDYDNMFRIMYNYPPLLDGINIADAYVQCKSLLTLADQYDALPVVGPRVDHHLLQFQSRLWKQIAKYPISYLRLGYLSRSKVIFQEALIHVVGQWPAGERSIRAALPEAVLDIIEDKVDELEETVSRIEGKLFRLTLTNRAGERVAPGTNYLDWLAVSLFRQWLADNTTPAPVMPLQIQQHAIPERRRGEHAALSNGNGNGGSRARSESASGHHGVTHGGGGHHGGSNARPGSTSQSQHQHQHQHNTSATIPPLASLGRTYRVLGTAGGADIKGYLSHDECKRFLKLTPELYSRDNLRRFEKRIDELKALAREVVRPLMGTGLELEMGPGGREASGAIGYLTCTTVGDRDLPWEVYD